LSLLVVIFDVLMAIRMETGGMGGFVLKALQYWSDRCAEQFFNRKLFGIVTELPMIAATMAAALAVSIECFEHHFPVVKRVWDRAYGAPHEAAGATEATPQSAGAAEATPQPAVRAVSDADRALRQEVHFEKKLTKSSLGPGYVLTLPTKSDLCQRLLHRNHEIKLLDSDGEVFHCSYIYKKGISAGWRLFAVSHALEVGDKIHLVLKDSVTMLVTWTRRLPVLEVLEQAKVPIGARIKIYWEPMNA
jgi:hypothetical protein